QLFPNFTAPRRAGRVGPEPAGPTRYTRRALQCGTSLSSIDATCFRETRSSRANGPGAAKSPCPIHRGFIFSRLVHIKARGASRGEPPMRAPLLIFVAAVLVAASGLAILNNA